MSTTDPTGSSDGSDAATPFCAGTPEVVVMPLQYAVAPNVSRAPGVGAAAASGGIIWRVAYFESSARTSYSDTKLPTAIAVTRLFRQNEPEMIIAVSIQAGDDGSCHGSAAGLSR